MENKRIHFFSNIDFRNQKRKERIARQFSLYVANKDQKRRFHAMIANEKFQQNSVKNRVKRGELVPRIFCSFCGA